MLYYFCHPFPCASFKSSNNFFYFFYFVFSDWITIQYLFETCFALYLVSSLCYHRQTIFTISYNFATCIKYISSSIIFLVFTIEYYQIQCLLESISYASTLHICILHSTFCNLEWPLLQVRYFTFY